MRALRSALLATAACLALSACPFEASLEKGPPRPDTQPEACKHKDAGRDLYVCPAACAEQVWVINRVIFPTDSTESEKYALEFQGKKYNSLSGILALVSQQAPALNLAQWVQDELLAGQALNLLQVRAIPAAGDLGVAVRTLGRPIIARSQACCATPGDRDACRQQGLAGCFSGQHTFSADPAAPSGPWLEGSLQGGRLRLGPGPAALRLGNSAGQGLEFSAKQALIRADLSAGSLDNGILTTALSRQEMQDRVVPWMAYGLNRYCQDSKTDQVSKDLLKIWFDEDRNGAISAAALANSALFRTFLDGDVDLDCDGVKELSFGFGFSAVGARLK